MQADDYAVILAGGRGERFWPLSTARTPKQFLKLTGGETMLAAAVRRLEGLIPPDRIFVITSADLAGAAREAAPVLPAENIVGEPVGRDTAAAVAVGAAVVKARSKAGAFCVLTADQIIGDLQVFRQTLADSFHLAREQEVLITIGIPPSHPSTGFGYIESDAPIARPNCSTQFFKTLRFVEKPDRPTAEEYIRTGRYYWNSGMFIWSVKAIETALRSFRPPLHELMQRLVPMERTSTIEAALVKEYPKLERISIDYAVMEKARNIVMARGSFAWDDVGAWTSLENHFPKDASGNVAVGACEGLDSAGNIVLSEGRLTALIGVRDMVVVQAEGVTLICPKSRAQEVKKLVEKLRAKGGYERLL